MSNYATKTHLLGVLSVAIVNRAHMAVCAAIATVFVSAGYAQAAVITTKTTSNAPGVLVSGTTVSLYVPYASDNSLRTGSIVKVIEAASGVTIPKTVSLKTGYVNSCAASPATGIAVCSGDFGSSFFIRPPKNSVGGFKTDITRLIHFTGGDCANCGVIIDDDFTPSNPTAIISTSKGYLPVELVPFQLGTIISTNDDVISGDFGYDPVNHRILSPNYTIESIKTFKTENPDYQIIEVGSGTPTAFDLTDKTSFFNSTGTCVTNSGGTTQRDALPDSGAYDINTGIAYGTFRSPSDCVGANTVEDLALFDLTQASFNSNAGTWTDADKQIQVLTEMTNLSNGLTGIAIPPGLSMAIVADRRERSGGGGFGALSLPTTSGSGIPALKDWVQAEMPSDPTGKPWQMTFMPNGLTAYTSPNNGKGYGVIVNRAHAFAAVVDIEMLLSAPRQTGTMHTLSSSVELVSSGIVRFVDIRPGH